MENEQTDAPAEPGTTTEIPAGPTVAYTLAIPQRPPAIEPAAPREETEHGGTTVWYGDRAALFAALARAQGSFPPIPRTREVEVRANASEGGRLLYTYRYAPLDQVIEACRAALSANGLAYTERVIEVKAGRIIVANLTHSSGAYGEARMLIPKMGRAQDFAGAITYARRIQRQCFLGVSPEEDVDAPEDEQTDRSYAGPPRGAPPTPQRQAAAPPARHPNAPVDEIGPTRPAGPRGVVPAEHDDSDDGRRRMCAADLETYKRLIGEASTRAAVMAIKTMAPWMIKPGVGAPDVEDLVADALAAFNTRYKSLPKEG